MDVPFALRAVPPVIPPGGEGKIAVVLDRASFGSGGIVTMSLSDKHTGGIQLSADLSLEDFTGPAKTSSHWYWPF